MLKPSFFPSLETRSTRLKLWAEKTTFFQPGTEGGFKLDGELTLQRALTSTPRPPSSKRRLGR
jgi:hypothetical protein